MKPSTIHLLIYALIPAAILLCPLSARGAEPRPNIIFLLADDMRWDAAGFAGNEIIQTPHLDALAKEGTVFENAFVTTAICAVSRASIFAGQYARRTGIYDFATRFSPEAWSRCYPALLRENGYRLGFIGKFGIGNAAPTNTFHYWDGFNGQGRYLPGGKPPHLTRRMGESALDFLSEHGEAPFCLSISFKSPHGQDGDRKREFPPDPADEDLYGDVEIPAGPTVSEQSYERLPEFLKSSEARKRWEYRFATPEMRQKTVKDYFRLITGMDREIGRIRAKLRELNLDDNTIIIFTSDNGFYLGEHGLAGKWFMHEESIRVPLVIYDPATPGSSKGKTVGAFALNIDVAPTILDFAGIQIPTSMQGKSLRPFVEGEQVANWRKDFFYEHHFDYRGAIPDTEGVREQKWKYVRYISSEPLVEALYHLQSDPFEQENLVGAGEHAETLDRLRQRWASYREELE